MHSYYKYCKCVAFIYKNIIDGNHVDHATFGVFYIEPVCQFHSLASGGRDN